MVVKGTFEVSLSPLEPYGKGIDGNNLGRMSISKTFSGDLSATSTGEMLTATTAIEGSAGYVALEQVEANLDGNKGSFILQHFGVMSKGSNSLKLEVVPDSGTKELKTLSGEMKIDIIDGKHHYEFSYHL